MRLFIGDKVYHVKVDTVTDNGEAIVLCHPIPSDHVITVELSYDEAEWIAERMDD